MFDTLNETSMKSNDIQINFDETIICTLVLRLQSANYLSSECNMMIRWKLVTCEEYLHAVHEYVGDVRTF